MQALHGVTQRRRDIISGVIAIVLVFGIATIGVKWAFGAFDRGYTLFATFEAAGQGLIDGSDIKIRGVDVGHVDSVELRDGQAFVTMFINRGVDIPSGSLATIRPKTLFGEKFIDIDTTAADDPNVVFEEGDTFPDDQTLGGFELEDVLGDAFPILQAIDPEELMTVIDSLADGGEGMGETISRTIENSAILANQAANRDPEFRTLVESLNRISNELAGRADDVVTGAQRLNEALPVITENDESLASLLQQLERLSGQFADLLIANQAFIDSAFTLGQDVIDVLDANRNQVVPLVIGLRQFLQFQSAIMRVPFVDGTQSAAVQGLLGSDLCHDFPTLPNCTTGAVPGAAAADVPVAQVPIAGPSAPAGLGAVTGEVSTGTQAIIDLVTGLLGGGPR
ncbi:MAG: MCE family protein [Acidimicrobiales bacterium]